MAKITIAAKVQHLGTPATKAHAIGVLTLEQAGERFAGQHERGWGRLTAADVARLVRQGGRWAHFSFDPVEAA